MINQHLISGTFEEISDYFGKKVVPFDGIGGAFQELVEIPSMIIKNQLADIYAKEQPKTGFIFYFLRNIINKNDGTFSVSVNLGMEMVWIREQGKHYNQLEYPQSVFNEIMKHQENVNVISILQKYGQQN
jgi:hypothetical protein